MAQQHLDRLTAVDASFLAQEGPTSHMHVGAVMIFDGPPPGYVDFVNQIRARLHLVPRYRQKLAFPPIETGRPVWIDDPSFNLEYHVRNSALPKPGSIDQLHQLGQDGHRDDQRGYQLGARQQPHPRDIGRAARALEGSRKDPAACPGPLAAVARRVRALVLPARAPRRARAPARRARAVAWRP